MELTEANLAKTIDRLRFQNTDDSLVEAKKCQSKLSDDIWESVSAFANTHGGLLVLGIDEQNGFVPTKNFAIEKVLKQFISGMGDGGSGNKITNAPAYEPLRFQFEGANLLAIQIHELPPQQKPCYITAFGEFGGSFKRIDDRDIKLSSTEVFELKNAYIASSADRCAVPGAQETDLNAEICNAIIARAKAISPRAISSAPNRTSQLMNLNLLNSAGQVTMTGLLCAGVYPQRFFPKLNIDVAVHPDNQKSQPNMPRFVDRAICEGTLGEMLEDALAAIAKNLRRISTVKGLERIDELEIPEEVLREALANALAHREYSENFQGQGIAVDIFPNRIEITNPGSLWGGKTLENLSNGQSFCRNSALMKLLSIAPLPKHSGAAAEGNGTGIIQMIRMMDAAHLNPPIFQADFTSFKVTLERKSDTNKAPKNNNSEGKSADEATDFAETDAQPRSKNQQILQEMYLILEALASTEEASSAQLREATGLSKSIFRDRLNRLIAKKQVEPTAPATSKLRRYKLKK